MTVFAGVRVLEPCVWAGSFSFLAMNPTVLLETPRGTALQG